MRQAEFKLRAANAQVGVAQTDLFPKIRLTSNYGFESDELSSILKSPAGFIAGSLLQPIFAMGKNKAKVKAAKARYEQEVYSYEKSVLGAFKGGEQRYRDRPQGEGDPCFPHESGSLRQ